MGHNAELLRQAKAVQAAMPEDLRPALAALERLLADDGDLGEADRAQLLADVRALLAYPREVAIMAQARVLAGVLVALLG